jgi:hypothetical protein
MLRTGADFGAAPHPYRGAGSAFKVCMDDDRQKGMIAAMIFGLTTFTFVHVLLSLIGIFSGFIVMFGLLAAKPLNGWTALFLASTVLTSATGFLFPFRGFLPSHGVGIISLFLLAVALFARYGRHLAGRWRQGYVVSAMTALYLNVFVLLVQAFRKVPALKAIAPTESEPPFKITQLVVLAIFVVLTIVTVIRFHKSTVRGV